MGDRTNPIKFGPEWLRNMPRERATTGSSGAAPPGMGGPRPAGTPNVSGPRVLLARLRYGREEMLALYDRQTAEAPALLKSNDTLYQPRGKPPFALSNSFEDDTRDNANRQASVAGIMPLMHDRYAGRGRGRDPAMENNNQMPPWGEIRGKARGYYRPNTTARVWHGHRIGGAHSVVPDDDTNQVTRSWNNANNLNQTSPRPNNGEQPDWQTKQAQYRVKRQTSTNWRQQQSRDEGEEWRSADGSRKAHEKWAAEWGWQPESSGRPTQDKQWNNSRRAWVGGEIIDDPLPEWAVDNAEACGGTFDSSGAFHGYSNDDSNLPKNQENPYPLMKSHTHGSFARPKTVEEGSEEWWASEKAKKLSPKRFDTADIKKAKPIDSNLKKAINLNNTEENADTDMPDTKKSEATVSKPRCTVDTGAIPKQVLQFIRNNRARALANQSAITPGDPEKTSPGTEQAPEPSRIKEKTKPEEPTKDKYETRFDNEKQGEKGNIQSVIITSNNTLRQKHQNITVTPTETPKRQPKLMEYLESNKPITIKSKPEEFDASKGVDSDKIVEDILQMSLDDGIPSATINQMLTSHNNPAMSSLSQVPFPTMQTRMPSAVQTLGLQNPLQSHAQDGYNRMMQPVGMTNSMLNASLGLPLPNSTTGVTQPLANPGLSNQTGLGLGLGMQQNDLQAGMQPGHMQGFGGPPLNMPSEMPENLQATSPSNAVQLAINRLFPRPVHEVFPNDPGKAYALQRIRELVYKMYGGNVPKHSQLSYNNQLIQHIHSADQWWYEDPNNTIQGPFSSVEMLHWFRAGFFSPTLLVRRGCDSVLRPLANYGPMPFGPMSLIAGFPLPGSYNLQSPQMHDAANQPQPAVGANTQSLWGPLWGQPTNNATAPDRMWMPNDNSLANNLRNNFSYNFWDKQTSEMPAAPQLPEKMKTEEEILAQMRAAQAKEATSPLSFFADSPAVPQEAEANTANSANVNFNINQLQELLQKEVVTPAATPAAPVPESKQVPEKAAKTDTNEDLALKTNKSAEKVAETKTVKELKNDNKQKGKEPVNKPKNKKAKDDKKEEISEAKPKEEEAKVERRSAEQSPSAKNKKDDKSSKKELEKEKKEWIKEGFTIVKGSAKTSDKDSKKKAEEIKIAEEIERKRKEEEKQAAEEKKRLQEAIKKQQQECQAQQASRQAAESVSKKAPWSASIQAVPTSREGLTLAEIQRLEREKKLEQMKEQQHMMQIIAQQQAVALARDQEIQAGLGWAKKANSASSIPPTLAEIQTEARKQAVVGVVPAPHEEAQLTPPPVNPLPWGNIHNGGGGFWDCPQPEPMKPVAKQPEFKSEPKNKKKVTVMAPPKPENTPSVEFELWCTNMLASWQDTGIDVPTFVSFLRDIESPYEVKDYVKCYLGDTREANDFARQFVERRSRLMRVGMVTPSDDLCSPAVAVNPRTNSLSDHNDLKAKGKKTKKNKMLKVDARNILGFSVTASEDRINVGDIDTV